MDSSFNHVFRSNFPGLGEHYADRYKWKKAAQYFTLSRNLEQLAECYYRLGEFRCVTNSRSDLCPIPGLLVTRVLTWRFYEL